MNAIQISKMLARAHRLTCFGWTGRNKVVQDNHIAELVAHGIPAPSGVPIALELSPYLLTNHHEISVVSGSTSGEVEYCLIQDGNNLLVTVASDHTDRDIERISVPVSKQACAKCLASEAWSFNEVAAHWDELTLHSWVFVEGRKSLYQQGKLSEIMRPEVLLGLLSPSVAQTTFVFSGTLPTLGGLVYGNAYELEIVDPVLVRKITHKYNVRVMPQRL